jgi:hypothetical protein
MVAYSRQSETGTDGSLEPDSVFVKRATCGCLGLNETHATGLGFWGRICSATTVKAYKVFELITVDDLNTTL